MQVCGVYSVNLLPAAGRMPAIHGHCWIDGHCCPFQPTTYRTASMHNSSSSNSIDRVNQSNQINQINQSINQSIKSINQSMNQSINQSINQNIDLYSTP